MTRGAADGEIIHILPGDVIDRIAAGEVIERPASIVKELLENAFDAGAESVELHLEEGGLERLVVSDDGCGMSPRDAGLAVLRHATSKLRSADDLFAIRTLGFRGEALSSIAAVARVTITTRRPGDAVGTRIAIEGGEVRSCEEAGCPSGTTVDVRDLFFNTPARRKFMRSPATEQAHACEAVLRVLLGVRRGGVVVASAERRLLDVPPEAEGEARVRLALGGRVGALFPFEREVGGLRASGFVARPDESRADAKGLWFFVNGRFVRDRLLQRALLDAYRGLLEKGRYPYAVVYLELPTEVVDVNVHPQKLEVRFSDAPTVYRALSSALNGVLAQAPWLGLRLPAGVGERRAEYLSGVPQREEPAPAAPSPPAALAGKAAEDFVWGGIGAASATGFFGRLQPLGRVFETFLLCGDEQGLIVIDQHAAHERVTFERLRQQRATGRIERQQLLFPEPVELPAHLTALLDEHSEALLAYGFEVEPVGPGRYAVRAVPALLVGARADELVRDLIGELAAIDEVGPGEAARDAEVQLLSRIACHGSVRAGQTLSPAETRALLLALDEVDFAAHCPHGRPVYHRIDRAELLRWFHRP
jgi:DNA mismatch repair protein MutL